MINKARVLRCASIASANIEAKPIPRKLFKKKNQPKIMWEGSSFQFLVRNTLIFNALKC